jgi:hypothetical protein
MEESAGQTGRIRRFWARAALYPQLNCVWQSSVSRKKTQTTILSMFMNRKHADDEYVSKKHFHHN